MPSRSSTGTYLGERQDQGQVWTQKMIAEVTPPARHPSAAVWGHQRACRAVPGPRRMSAAAVGPFTHRDRPRAAEQAPEPSPNTSEAQPGRKAPGCPGVWFCGFRVPGAGQPFHSFQLKWSHDHCCETMAATRPPAPRPMRRGENWVRSQTRAVSRGDRQRLHSVLGAPPLPPRGPSSPDVSVCEKESVGAQFLFLQELRMVLPMKIA